MYLKRTFHLRWNVKQLTRVRTILNFSFLSENVYTRVYNIAHLRARPLLRNRLTFYFRESCLYIYLGDGCISSVNNNRTRMVAIVVGRYFVTTF